MVEPLEETRSELIFATEPVLSSLELSIPGARRNPPLAELDEVEVCAIQSWKSAVRL
jgi:SCY1-like protein 2